MPELPEVETMVRGIRPHVEGRTIVELRACPTPCKPITITPAFGQLAKRTAGRTITSVRRIAKRVVLDLSDGANLAIEPRMTGLMLLSDPPDREHLRLQWILSPEGEFPALWFWDRRGLGTVRLYRPGELAEHLLTGLLGPDALTVSLEDWLTLLARTARAVKVALLDQKLIAGIGNLYASEILHRARVHPETPAKLVPAAQVAAIREATLTVLHEAIQYEGSTLSDGTYRNALNHDGSYQNAHRVYDREGQNCRTCAETSILRIVQAQRSTFYCPACQPPAKPPRRRR